MNERLWVQRQGPADECPFFGLLWVPISGLACLKGIQRLPRLQ